MLKSLYLRRRALFAPQNSCDPIFTPLEYIKSDDSKTQYIILDYKPNHKTKIIMESKIDEDGGAGFAYGADNGWGVNDFALYYGYKSTSTLINAWGNVAASQYSFNISSVNDEYLTFSPTISPDVALVFLPGFSSKCCTSNFIS